MRGGLFYSDKRRKSFIVENISCVTLIKRNLIINLKKFVDNENYIMLL